MAEAGLARSAGRREAAGAWEEEARRKLVERNGAPAYFQIAEFFRERITKGVLAPDDQMPTETEVMQAFSVSRHTARNAIQTLVVDGLLAKFPGRGTFVLDRGKEEPVWAIGSFASFMSQSYPGEPEILAIDWIRTKTFRHPLSHHAKWKGSPFLRVSLVRRQDTQIFSYAIIDIPNHIAKQIRSEIDGNLPRLPIMNSIEQICGIRIEKIRQSLKATTVDAETADHLKVAEGSPALRLVNAFFDGDGNPVELSQIFFRPDGYEHNFEIARGDSR